MEGGALQFHHVQRGAGQRGFTWDPSPLHPFPRQSAAALRTSRAHFCSERRQLADGYLLPAVDAEARGADGVRPDPVRRPGAAARALAGAASGGALPAAPTALRGSHVRA